MLLELLYFTVLKPNNLKTITICNLTFLRHLVFLVLSIQVLFLVLPVQLLILVLPFLHKILQTERSALFCPFFFICTKHYVYVNLIFYISVFYIENNTFFLLHCRSGLLHWFYAFCFLV